MAQRIALQTVRLWRDYPLQAVLFGGAALAAFAAMAGAAWSSPTLPDRAIAAKAPPAPPPLLVRQLAVDDAIAINRRIPLADGPNPAASPFSLGKAGEGTRAQALECLTSAVYYEAGSESADGQRAVAQVVLNRVRHPAFPASVCGVVYEGSTRATGCQFTFTCDGSLLRRPVPALWERARKVAWAALTGFVHKPVGNATHYHANYVVPYWASSLTKNAVVGTHIFYRWSGGWGRPAAFGQRYAQREPNADALRLAAAQAEQKTEAEAVVAEVPGAEALPAPEADGKGRVAVRFNLEQREAARKAVEEAPRVDYVDEVKASDNLRWLLTGNEGAGERKPLGTAVAAKSGGAQATGSPN
jgi:spore germination cell wall hydrolase CwlJ-like protein